MKVRLVLPMVAGLALAAWTPIASAQTTTTLSNVAVQQPAEGNGALPQRGVDDGVFRYYLGDDTGTENYWKVDLGQEYDVGHLVIDCRYSDTYGPPRLNGATLMAFGPMGTTKVADNLVLSGFLASTEIGGPVYSLTFDNGGAGYSGVQYFQIGGQDPEDPLYPLGTPLGVDYLTVGEFKAYAEVPLYDTFIQGVTATANVTNNHPGVSPMFIVNNSGMDDQRTLLGDPSASHLRLSGQGTWSAGTDPPEIPVLTFDLGTTYDLSQISVWNNHQVPYFNIRECLIEHSMNGTDWTALDDTNDAEQGNYTLTMNDFTEPIPPSFPATDAISLSEITAQFIRMTLLSNYGPHPNGHEYYALSEVRFYGEETVVPDIPGDADRNGRVDNADAQALALNWGSGTELEPATWEEGNFDGDWVVGPKDAAIMAANWGYGVETSGSEGTPTPEPSVLLLLLAGLASVIAVRRTRR